MSQLTQRQWWIIGGSVGGAVVLILLAVAIVLRGGNSPADDPLAAPTVTLSELSPLNPLTTTLDGGYPPPAQEPITPSLPITATLATITSTLPTSTAPQFTNLRVASSVSAQPANTFAAGTQEIWMLWDYSGMTANDRTERYWYHNNELYVRREAAWDFAHYGTVGTVSDIFLFNRAPQILPGDWRIELWLNGTKVLETTFTVAG